MVILSNNAKTTKKRLGLQKSPKNKWKYSLQYISNTTYNLILFQGHICVRVYLICISGNTDGTLEANFPLSLSYTEEYFELKSCSTLYLPSISGEMSVEALLQTPATMELTVMKQDLLYFISFLLGGESFLYPPPLLYLISPPWVYGK